MKMKKYMVYLDDGRDAMRIAVPAKTIKEAREFVKGNGDVIAVKDVTEDYPISEDAVINALRKANFGEIETDFIIRALREISIIDMK